MKKFLLLTFIMLFSISLVACTKSNEDVTNISENKFGLVLSVTSYDAHYIFTETKSIDKDNIYLNNENGEELGTGTEFSLQKYNEETKEYEDVPYIIDNIAWEEPLFIINKENNKLEQKLRYDYIYGELTPGLYQVTKPFLYVKEPGNFEKENLVANFEVTKEDYEKEQNKTPKEKLDDTLKGLKDDDVIHLPMQQVDIKNEDEIKNNKTKNNDQTQIVFEDAILTWNDDKTEFYLSLKGNPTTGYTWEVNNNGTFATCDNNYNYVSDAPKTDDPAKMIVGAGGRFNYTIKIDKSKRTSSNATVVSFKYYRSWEGDASIINEIHVLFDIDNNGNINAAVTRPVV